MSSRLIPSTVAAALVASAASAAPLLTLGDNTELFVNASVEVRYDDNIFLTDGNEESDVIFSLSPGVELRSGKEGISQSSLFAGVDLSGYAENDSQNSSQVTIIGETSYTGARLSGSAEASYRQLDQNTTAVLGVLQEFIERDLYSVGARLEYAWTPKISSSAGVTYDMTEYREALPFTDTATWTVPVNIYYKFRPKLDLSAGYRFRSQDTEVANAGGTSHYFNVGARGEITPKLLADFSIGIESRDSDSGSDGSILAFDGGLNWEITPKINSRLSFGRSFDVSALGTELERTDVVLSTTYAPTTDITGSASISYQNANYATERDDNFYEFSVGVSYSLNQFWSLSGGYTYRTNESNVSAADFANNTLRFGASVRY